MPQLRTRLLDQEVAGRATETPSLSRRFLEPGVGIEPTTTSLQEKRSTD